MVADRFGPALADVYDDQTNLERVRALDRPRRLAAAGRLPGVTAIVLNLDHPELIVPLAAAAATISSQLERHGLGFELLVGDTGSRHPDVRALLEDPPPSVTAVPGLTYHFARNNNDVYDGRARFDHLLLLNNDVLLRDAGPLLAMVGELAAHPEAGIVGLVLDLPDGTLQHGGVDFVRDGPAPGIPVHPTARTRRPHRPGSSWPALATTGAALMIRSELWELLGGLDEAYQKECQDVDLCLRALRQGWTTRVVDAGPLVHLENGTRPKGDASPPDRRLFRRRWLAFLEATNA